MFLQLLGPEIMFFLALVNFSICISRLCHTYRLTVSFTNLNLLFSSYSYSFMTWSWHLQLHYSNSNGVANGNPLQYSCLDNPMNRGAWQATVHGVTKSQVWLSNWTHTLIVKASLWFLLIPNNWVVVYIHSVISVAQSCLTLCNPMDCSMPGFPVHHWLPELAQTQVHWFGDGIQPSYPLSSPSSAFNLSQPQSLFQWVSSSNQGPKVLEFQLQHRSFQWIFRTDFL